MNTNLNRMNNAVLVAGFTTRHVAASAARAGYTVYAVDHFCDADLVACTADHMAFDELDELPFAIAAMQAKYHPDFVITTSGAELLEVCDRLGTSPRAAARFMDKGSTQDFFEELGVPVPPRAKPGVYPAMAKTLAGAGGWRNAVIHSDAELEEWKKFVEDAPFMMQEIVSGTPASVCCLASEGRAVALCSNEQLLRGGSFCPYAFSGSVTPCTHPQSGRMIMLAEKIAAASGCTGSIGIDFVLTDDEAYAIELNPRFQGTTETVEMALGINMFTLHKNACLGHLPTTAPTPVCTAVRKVLTADKDLTISTDLMPLHDILTDIPYPGTVFEAGQVMVSVLGSGADRTLAFDALDTNIRMAVQYIRQ